jgi:hypothetical protein
VIFRAAGSGRGDGDAVHWIGDREAVPGLVLVVGEQGVVAGIAEVEGDLVYAGERVVPFRSGFYLDVGEACSAQEAWPVDT